MPQLLPSINHSNFNVMYNNAKTALARVLASDRLKPVRYFLGVAVLGPIAGVFHALTERTAIVSGLIGAGIAFAFSASLFTAIAWGVSMHILATLVETGYVFHCNRKACEATVNAVREAERSVENGMSNSWGFLKDLAKSAAQGGALLTNLPAIQHSPISKALITGFNMANRVAGRGNRPYGKKAQDCIDILDGSFMTSRPNNRPGN